MSTTISLFILPLLTCNIRGEYLPNWKSLDSRPLPSWYDEAKLGIFIHWGVYSVPSFGSEWFWWYWKGQKVPKYVNFMKQNYRPDFTYADFASQFTAELFDPEEWADLFQTSGAGYVVLGTKHHEGFCMWNTSYSFNWNAVAVGPKQDLVGRLAEAIRRKTKLHFGIYHSLFEWFNPIYLKDKKSSFKSQNFVTDKTMPELYELVNAYRPEIIWSDGDAGPADYWKSKEFLAWLYNKSPVRETVVTNDRWGNEAHCKHGGFLTCADRYQPHHLPKRKWESCMTIDKYSWGFRREANIADFLSMKEILGYFVKTVAYGGNFLLNIAPRSDGMISPIFQERLRQLGQWMQVNGEAIYKSQPWKFQNDSVTPDVYYTSKHSQKLSPWAGSYDEIYAITMKWPVDGILTLGAVNIPAGTKVSLLGYDSPLKWKKIAGGGVSIYLPQHVVGLYAWGLKIQLQTSS